MAGRDRDHSLAYVVEVEARLHQHLGSDPLALPDDPQQDVFGVDVVVAELRGLASRQLKDSFGARREGHVPAWRPCALTDQLADLLPGGIRRDPEVIQDTAGVARALEN